MCAVKSSTRPQYWAFISYSHNDAVFGRKLHRWLERYVLPWRIRGAVTQHGPLPRRLAPIFRDRDELAVASDLSSEVHAALDRSRALIVVCSRAAAASAWVNREVELFRKLHPERPIFAAIISGEPGEAFPHALRLPTDDGPIEPLAADFRPEGDGKRLALLKLIAGLSGLSLDSLVQRDAQRRLQRVMAVTAASFVLALLMVVLTVFALNAKAEANRQRAEAEGLVEFMLTDLRTTLKGVGRLDAMTAVNARALQYYGDQNLSRLPPDSLERRARILHAMGEDDLSRGALSAAMTKFAEAKRTTAAILDAAPNDPDRVFAHAQSEFWIGYMSYIEGHRRDAYDAFSAYSSLADRLLKINPEEPRYQKEKGYAEGNLCSLYLKPPVDKAAALHSCISALRFMEMAQRRLGSDKALTEDLANRHAWLADACYINRDKFCEKRHRQIQEGLIQELMRTDRKNMQLKNVWVRVERSLALIDAEDENAEKALMRLRNAAFTLDEMIQFDPTNKTWQAQRIAIERDIKSVTAPSPNRRN